MRFAATGGEGVHFSFLRLGPEITVSSPVVVTIPAGTGKNFIVGETLHEFLCLGVQRGYFALEQLGYFPKRTLTAYTSTSWRPRHKSDYGLGFEPDERNRQILGLLTTELGLAPWPRLKERFEELQARYMPVLDVMTVDEWDLGRLGSASPEAL